MTTYLVTGCAGFIASEVAAQLIDSGAKVVGIDNVNDYYDVRLKEHRLERLQSLGPDQFEFVRGDIESQETLAELFDKYSFDGVLNLAARAGVRYSMENPHVYMTTNAMGSLNLLDQMQRHGVKKYVLASTSSLYAGQPMPFVETLPVNTPISPYAASKKSAEAMAYAYHHLYDIDVTICRYFTVYGPAGRPDMCIFRFIKWIDEGTPIELFGDGEQARDFTYVSDIASGTIAALKPVGYEIVNLGGGGTPVSLNTVIEMLEERLGKKAKLNHKTFHKADIKTTSADITKARELLGWTPKVELDEGIDASVAWYREHQPWSSELLLP
ncbi:SDR family NAD(P)-dependent oxidoreductase [Aporhodopirellula aestuarii]|uniref:SDR family NAD(P)-dependent oxidoreductase n=1 Tax=Aporhodopirellula aestuarii TaxID=2950107 RepID=A0ABT0UB58_9BACT|nr:SDR family NAD(P)-dependent oxidoreductase [Aporhodopirellula aestuarii]MCM2374212.1 SDR family NAD(P)-dependent oxidoreductase [Aporhodopirellula aestuarii]